MHPSPIFVLPLIVVKGSITVSRPISTSTSITVASGSTMPTPARMCRSWIARCASLLTRASSTRSLTPSTSRSSSTTSASTSAPLEREQVEHLGQVQLALRVVRAQPRQRLPEGAALERIDARVHLRYQALLGGRVPLLLGLDNPLDRPARVAHHPPVAARIVEDRAEHRGGRAALQVSVDQPADRLGVDKRHVAAQDHDRRVGVEAGCRPGVQVGPGRRVELRHGRTDSAAGAVRPLLHRQVNPRRQDVLERPLRRVHHHDLSGSRLKGRLHRPQHHRPAAQLMQHLRGLRAHARALAGGEDQDGWRAHLRDANRLPVHTRLPCRAREPAPRRSRARLAGGSHPSPAGGQGFEPRFSGPKPDVLPLDDPPRVPEQ